MEILSKLGGITPVCEGAVSHFILEQSLVIYVKCPRSLVTSSNTFGQTIYVLAMSNLLEIRNPISTYLYISLKINSFLYLKKQYWYI